MSSDISWLPPLVFSHGDWEEYLEKLYDYFKCDFLKSKPKFGNKRVGLKREPISKGKEATFWHFIQESENRFGPKSEEERIPNFRRCERIRWPKPVMEQFTETEHESEKIVWWKTTRITKRGKESNYILALHDFSYIVVIADRGDYVLPWTQYPIEQIHRREKLKKEYEEYWRAKKAGGIV